MTPSFRPCRLTPIATNEGRFADFAPYVPSLNDDGTVAFQATLADGHSGVFVGDGQALTDIAATTAACPAAQFTSHPDINRAGLVTVYARLKGGGDAVLWVHPDGRIEQATNAGSGFKDIGPLGPTLNEQGDTAVRWTAPDGRACIGVAHGGRLQAVAETGERFCGFDGLPVVNNTGQVAFRATLPGGRQGVFVQHGGQCTTVAETGDEFTELGRFPALNDHGTTAFTARRRSGAWGVFTASAGRPPTCVLEADTGFESFRGVLLNNAGPVAFYGVPAGGQLGIYTGPDAARHRLLGLGDTLFGATVADFALNPVSVNEPGQLAIRVALGDGRQFILRADPAA